MPRVRSSLLAACCLLAGTKGDLSSTETQYVAVPSNITARENLAFITSKPHGAKTLPPPTTPSTTPPPTQP